MRSSFVQNDQQLFGSYVRLSLYSVAAATMAYVGGERVPRSFPPGSGAAERDIWAADLFGPPSPELPDADGPPRILAPALGPPALGPVPMLAFAPAPAAPAPAGGPAPEIAPHARAVAAGRVGFGLDEAGFRNLAKRMADLERFLETSRAQLRAEKAKVPCAGGRVPPPGRRPPL